MKYFDGILNWGMVLFVFLLPWQTRWIYRDAIIEGGVWEYGRFSLYATEIILLVLIIIGLLSRFLSKEAKPKLLFWLLFFLIAMNSGLSVFWSADKILALYHWHILAAGILLFYLVFGHKNRFSLKLSLIGAGLIQAMLGVYQFFTQTTFAFKWLGLPNISAMDQGSSVVEFLDQRWLRAYGAFPHPNMLGGFLAIALLVAVILLWQLNQKINHQPEISQRDFYLNIFYWFSSGAMFLGLVLSFSRSAVLAFTLGFAYLLIYSFIKKLKTETWLTIKLGIFFIVLLALLMAMFPQELFLTRVTAKGRLEQRSLIERQNSVKDALAIFKTNPVLGIGLGNFTKVLQANDAGKPGWRYQPVHSWYWLVLNELGALGFLLFVFLLINFWRHTEPIEKSLFLALLFIAFFDHYYWTLYSGIMLWWLVLGLLIQPPAKE